MLRDAAARSAEALWNVIGQLVGRFAHDECDNYLASSGYLRSSR